MILMLCDAKRELITLCKDTVIMEKAKIQSRLTIKFMCL